MVVVSAAIALGGCGGSGSGSSDDPGGGGSLSIRARWEQPASALRKSSARSADLKAPGGRDSSFGSAIPAAVNTVRITLVPSAGSQVPACCIGVPRGSQAFIDRRLAIASIPPGDVLVNISGYPTSFAPGDGIGGQCTTSPPGAGASCVDQRALASFASNDIPVSVVAGERASTGDVPIPSLPFLLDLTPAEGAVVTDTQVPISFAVVSANNPVVAGSITIDIEAGTPPQSFSVPLATPQPCDERGPQGTRCTTGPDLDVFGFLVSVLSPPLPAGLARITIESQDNAGRRVAFAYDVNVNPGGTTTIPPPTTTTLPPTTSTSPTSSTTQTTIETTTTTSPTTTLPLPFACDLTYSVTSAGALGGLEYTTDYSAAPGHFERPPEGPGCLAVPAGVFLVRETNDEVARTVEYVVSSSTGWPPGPVVRCKFFTADPVALAADNFAISVTQAVDPQLNPVTATVEITSLNCTPRDTTTTTLPPTTTTVSSTSTTTTTSTTATLATTTTLVPQTTTTTLPTDICRLTFSVPTIETLTALDFRADYTNAQGRFLTPAEGTRCEVLRRFQVTMLNGDNAAARILTVNVDSPNGFLNPSDIVECRFLTANAELLQTGDFDVTISDAQGLGGAPSSPGFALTSVACNPLTATTTTTTVPTNFDRCAITFGYQSPVTISDLRFTVGYASTGGGFEGKEQRVICDPRAGQAHLFNDDDLSQSLSARMFSQAGVTGPADVAQCIYVGPAPQGFEQGFAVTPVVSNDPQGNFVDLSLFVTGVQCGL